MRYFDGRFLIYDSETKFKLSDLDRESLYSIGGTSQVTLKIHEGTGLLLPFMVTKSLGDPNIFNLKDWIRQMIQNESKQDLAKAALTKQFTAAGIKFEEEDIDAIIQGPLLAKKGEHSNLNQNLSAFVKDPLARRNFRRRALVEDAEYKHPNVTLNQEAEFDPVGIKLIQSSEVYTHVLGEEYPLTPIVSARPPYPNFLYKIPHIEYILKADSPTERRKLIDDAIDYISMDTEVRKALKPEMLRSIRGNFESLPLAHVLGNPDNDTMPIQENEKSFYENLITFMEYHILKFNEEVMKNSTEEEIKNKTQDDINKGLLPQRLQEYMLRLLKDALSEGFMHTGNYVLTSDDVQDDTESDTSAENEKAVGFATGKADASMSDLHFIAANYLIYSSEKYGISAWAEGIVKAMRWGENKIRNLNVGVNNTQYLDLKTMNYVTQQISDLTQFSVSKDSKGRYFDVTDYSYIDFTAKGQYGAISYPFVLAGVEYGYLPGVKDDIAVEYITTLFDVVKDYQEGRVTIYDLGYTNGKFVDELERDSFYETEIETFKGGKVKIKISDELVEYAMDNAVPKMEGTAFSFVSPIDLTDLKNDEPLLGRLGEVSKSFRREEVHGGLLAVFNEGGSDKEFSGLADLLNWYQEEVYPTHLEGYLKLLGLSNDTKLNVTNLQTSHFFDEVEVPEEKEENKFMYPIYEGPELSFSKIVRSAKDSTVIGGYAQLPTGERVFASTTEMAKVDLNGESLIIGKVIVGLFETMLSADTRNEFTSKTKVISESSVFEIYKSLYRK